MTPVEDAAAVVAQYVEIQMFYAHQMHSGDDADFPTWIETFTEDAVVYANAWPEPAVGRDAIQAAGKFSSDERDARGAVGKHIVSMIKLTPDSLDGYEDAVTANIYVEVVEAFKGQPLPTPYRSNRFEDRLVRSGGRWYVRSRKIMRDDLPANAGAVGLATAAA